MKSYKIVLAKCNEPPNDNNIFYCIGINKLEQKVMFNAHDGYDTIIFNSCKAAQNVIDEVRVFNSSVAERMKIITE